MGSFFYRNGKLRLRSLLVSEFSCCLLKTEGTPLLNLKSVRNLRNLPAFEAEGFEAFNSAKDVPKEYTLNKVNNEKFNYHYNFNRVQIYYEKIFVYHNFPDTEVGILKI